MYCFSLNYSINIITRVVRNLLLTRVQAYETLRHSSRSYSGISQTIESWKHFLSLNIFKDLFAANTPLKFKGFSLNGLKVLKQGHRLYSKCKSSLMCYGNGAFSILLLLLKPSLIKLVCISLSGRLFFYLLRTALSRHISLC